VTDDGAAPLSAAAHNLSRVGGKVDKDERNDNHSYIDDPPNDLAPTGKRVHAKNMPEDTDTDPSHQGVNAQDHGAPYGCADGED
jgi:hypothetical protein